MDEENLERMNVTKCIYVNDELTLFRSGHIKMYVSSVHIVSKRRRIKCEWLNEWHFCVWQARARLISKKRKMSIVDSHPSMLFFFFFIIIVIKCDASFLQINLSSDDWFLACSFISRSKMREWLTIKRVWMRKMKRDHDAWESKLFHLTFYRAQKVPIMARQKSQKWNNSRKCKSWLFDWYIPRQCLHCYEFF